jgi:DNA-binding LacI/PurR family transcriptional regulator
LGYAFRDPGAVEFLHGLGEACTERGRSLLMIPAAPNAGRVDTVLRAAVDGFVISSVSMDDPLLAAALSRPQPAVIVDSPRGMAGVDFVGIDDRSGFTLVAKHVLELGHRRIGVVAVRRDEDVSAVQRPIPLPDRLKVGRQPHPVRQLRLSGLRDVLADQALAWVTERVANSRDEGSSAAVELLDSGLEISAIMCTSDILALGVLDELASRGLRAGADLTVTGFDDVLAAGPAGLTTVHQPMEAKGRAAIESLLDGRPRELASRTILPIELVLRSSSGPVR